MNTYMAMWDKVVNTYSAQYGPYFQSYKAKTGMKEITLIGRAGEGVWMAGELLGAAAIDKGKYGKVIFTMPGERRNTPTRSFVRFADAPVHFPVSWIHSADDMIILEEELLTLNSPVLDLDISTMTRRMAPDGFCVINSLKPPAKLRKDVAGKPVTVDATNISITYLGTPFFMNIPLIGAYLAVSKDLTIEEMQTAINGFINPRGHQVFKAAKMEATIKALRAGYESARY
jgi:2-oxoacid:acceptor oxidoreductase gamma subunit (pyruvate/2-ketoisovalerate family)